ncbi:PrsW family intramembrane metalloprotease [Microlunatus flavus]|uniref:Membrane proteinase PrsW, cleaves anti-sigma factor RsiW, M82 family n=1 Tax=Microlunatus flavus TaxID=1036181 RepID=A0A1H9J9I9_9ACTN|nr:PrsW family intramembrane metalloprotease [Microlunatus flavus]SEQ83486.1 Membrane proteinase PrsW, cleaves anti-sigma factor RsiW, M82 family [Microlunatus flavus]
MSGPSPVPVPVGQPVVPPALLRHPRSALTWVTTVVLGLGALVIAGVFVAFGGLGPVALVTFLAALAFPVILLVIFWLDRYEPEPARYRLAALGWGGVVAVILSFVVESAASFVTGQESFVSFAVVAPVVEETGKGLFLVAVVLLRRQQIHGLLDGVVYGALVGVGFAFVEDILYYLSALQQEGPAGLTATVVLRGVMSPFAHPLFTSATGLGFGIGLTSRSRAKQVVAPVLGFLTAVALHGIWNGSAGFGTRNFLIAYGVVMLPLLLVVVGVAIWARSREGRMLVAALQQTVQMGWTRPEEVRWVARLSDRVSARHYAGARGGKPGARAMRAFQQTMIEIAFLHNRFVNGTAPRDVNQRMLGLLDRAAALRPYVILPPEVPRPGYGGGPQPPATVPAWVPPGLPEWYGPGAGTRPSGAGWS